MQIQHIIYFLETAKCKKINAAAQNLFISPSTLSSAIASLENELGFTLFYRSKTGLTLTAKGRKIIDQAEQIISFINYWKTLANDATSSANGVVQIFTPSLIHSVIVNEVVCECRNQYPNITLSIDLVRDKNLFTLIQNNNSSIILFFSKQSDYESIYHFSQKHKMNTEIIFKDYNYIWVNKEAFNSLTELSISDLKEKNILVYPNDNILSPYYEITKLFPAQNHFAVDQLSDMLDLISKSTDFFGIYSSLIAIKENTHIQPKKLKDYALSTIIVMVYPDEQHITSAENLLINLIKKEFKKITLSNIH